MYCFTSSLKGARLNNHKTNGENKTSTAHGSQCDTGAALSGRLFGAPEERLAKRCSEERLHPAHGVW